MFQAVLADLNDSALPGGGPLQTPSWEGNLIDATVLAGPGGLDGPGGLGDLGGPALRQFALRHDELAAGLVQGFGPGTLFALVADPAAAEVLGFAQIEVAEATRAWLRPVADSCQPQAGALCPVAGTLPQQARYARLVARPVDLALRLSLPRDLATGAVLAGDDPLRRALEAAVAAVNAGGEVQVLLGDEAAAVQVAAARGKLWFGRRVASATTPVGLSWQPGDPVALSALLVRIAGAERLAALLTAVAAEGSPLNPAPVVLRSELARSRLADLDAVGQVAGQVGGQVVGQVAGQVVGQVVGQVAAQPGDPVRECRRALAAAAPAQALDLASASEFKQCDLLSLSVQGATAGDRNVNRIHIDSQFCAHAVHEHVEGAPVAAPLGPPMVICSD